jgi:hypothetical protein
LPVGQILGPKRNKCAATVFGRMVVMMTENVCSALKWGADTLGGQNACAEYSPR